MLQDNFGRTIDYLRLSVTDRCNLRCTYCMPQERMKFKPRAEILSYEEMLRILRIGASLGINKVRFTGGEPFVRRDFISFLEKCTKIQGISSWNITSNGVLLNGQIQKLQEIGVTGINISLDSLDERNFFEITRRNDLSAVLQTIDEISDSSIHLKINAVAMKGVNESELVELAKLAQNNLLEVRFIEEMPFNGTGSINTPLNHSDIYELLSTELELKQLPSKSGSTSIKYSSPGFKGVIGIIPAYTRTICGSCNRLRISATGEIKSCLFGKNQLNLLQLLRSDASDNAIENALIDVVSKKKINGFIAEEDLLQHAGAHASMSQIGG